METETTTGLQAWLKARTAGISVIASAPLQTLVSRFQSRSKIGGIAKVGICMAFNRLMNFHVVRSTKAITFSPSVFLGDPAYRHQREPWHVKNHADYPDANYYLNNIQKYYFRHPDLRHLRHEQFNRGRPGLVALA